MIKYAKYFLLGVALVCSGLAVGNTEFDQDVTPDAIFGSGNSNGYFTTVRVDGIELGLRAKVPFKGLVNSTGDGRYQYFLSETDHDNNPGTDNRWNFDWTINTDFDNSNNSKLSAYTYELGMDADPGVGVDYLVFDPITPTAEVPFYDHSMGDNSTANGAGVEAVDAVEYQTLLDNSNVLQQSWRYSFFPEAPLDAYDASVPGIYHAYIAIKDLNGLELARNVIVINIVKDPGDDLVTPEVIFGSGNANGDFTINRDSGVEVGLRAKIPFSGLIQTDGNGRYHYSLDQTDHDGNPGTAKRWNFDWTVNTDFNNSNGTELNQYSYELGMDADPGAGVDYLIFDPVTPTLEVPFYDHSMGNNATANGAGIEATDAATYNQLLATSNVLQQSWRYAFYASTPPIDGYDPDVPGTYNVYLAVKDLQGNTISRTDIVVVIGGLSYDENVTPDVIFGSGNANGNFAIDRKSSVEVGLRAKIPFTGTLNSNGDGTYSYTLAETDHDNNPGTANRWNFDWSVNTDFDELSAAKISNFTYEMGLDADPGTGTDFVVFDPITPTVDVTFYDHAIGDNTTANGAGVEATDASSYQALIDNNNVVQNSWRYSFFDNQSPLDTYNPDEPGSYTVYLAVKDGAELIAQSTIQILIEDAPVNTFPISSVDAYVVNEDVVLQRDAFSGLLINDIDLDLDTLSIVNPGFYGMTGLGGVINLAADGSFEYFSPEDANGMDTLNYFVTDGFNQVVSSLSIEVLAVNDQPDFQTLGDVVYYNMTESGLRVIQDYAFAYDFGPVDESGQGLLGFNTQIVSDGDHVLDDAVVTSEGYLIMDFTANFGTALVEVYMQDDGGTALGGNDTSPIKTFSVSNLDLIFANGFEDPNGLKVLDYLREVKFYDVNTRVLQEQVELPYYDFPSNRIHFMGVSLILDSDFQSKQVLMQVKSWLKEVLRYRNLNYYFK